jgi:hypothetical protein
LESRVEDECVLGLESEKSKFIEMGVKSSIDSDKKPRSNNTTIPLSELILRDNGYDHMFTSGAELKKMERRCQQNVKELRDQTREMVHLIDFHLLVIEI